MVVELATGNRYGNNIVVSCDSVRTLFSSFGEVPGEFMLRGVFLCLQSWASDGDLYGKGLLEPSRTKV